MIIVDATDKSGRNRYKVTYETPGAAGRSLDGHTVQIWEAASRESSNPMGIGAHVMDLVFSTAQLADLAGMFPNKPRPSTSTVRRRT